MFKFSKKSIEKLSNPKFHPKLRQLMLEAIRYSPVDFTVIETLRTIEAQKLNVARGVSKTMKSRHIPSSNKSGLCEAVDIAPYPIDWSNIKRFRVLSEHIKNVAKILDINVSWGGDWKTFKDYPHWELNA